MRTCGDPGPSKVAVWKKKSTCFFFFHVVFHLHFCCVVSSMPGTPTRLPSIVKSHNILVLDTSSRWPRDECFWVRNPQLIHNHPTSLKEHPERDNLHDRRCVTRLKLLTYLNHYITWIFNGFDVKVVAKKPVFSGCLSNTQPHIENSGDPAFLQPSSVASAFVGDGNGHIRHVLWKAAIGTLGSASLSSQTQPQSRVPVVQYQWQYQWGANMF